jgi:hypothetical protein
VAEPAGPIPDPIPTITLVEAVQILGPHFGGDVYLVAGHVRRIIVLGVPPVPLFNGGHRVHRNCFPLGMIGVVGRYDPHDGKAYLEIRPLRGLDRWFWDAAMCTLGRAAFEANLPSSLLKKVFEVSLWATLIQDPSARRTKDSQPSGFGFEYCASHVRFRVFQQTARADKPQSAPPKPLPLPKSVAKKLKHGPQIDRVYPALQIDFPPHGKTPSTLSAERCRDRLSKAGHWKAENEEFELTDPSPDVVGKAMNLLGRTND